MSCSSCEVTVADASEKISRVLLMLADEQREVAKMEEGNIAVAVGMKNVRCPLHFHTLLVYLVILLDLYWGHSREVEVSG